MNHTTISGTPRFTARRAAATAFAAVALAAPLLLTGCGTSDAATDSKGDGTKSSQSDSSKKQDDAQVTLSDAWVKAADGMTGIFGTLENKGDEDITLVSAESPAAEMVQLHQTAADGTMSEKDGGFDIPAGGTFELEPGGNHIMLMEMPKALLAGDEVEVTLHFSDDSTLKTTALVKDYSGANENYKDDAADGSEGDDMDMSGSDGDMDMDMDHGSN